MGNALGTARKQHWAGDALPSLESEHGARGRLELPPSGTQCLCTSQTKTVLPKRCPGASFFPNPNALSRFVLVFVVFVVFLLCFVCDILVVEGVSSSSFSLARLCCPSDGLLSAGWFVVRVW